MHRALNGAVAIFTDDAITDARAFDWSQVSRRHVEKMRSVMGERAAAAATFNHMLSGIRSTVRIAWKLGLIDDRTRITIEDEPNEKPQPRRRAARYVAAGEVRRLFAALGTDPIGARDAAMLTLLYGAGLRRSEATALQLADYDQNTGVLTLRHDDGSTKRQVSATNGGKAALDFWLRVRGHHPGALLAPVDKGGSVAHRALTDQAVMMRVRTIVVQAGLSSLTPNDLRRSYSTEQESRQLVARKRGAEAEPQVPKMLPVPYQKGVVDYS